MQNNEWYALFYLYDRRERFDGSRTVRTLSNLTGGTGRGSNSNTVLARYLFRHNCGAHPTSVVSPASTHVTELLVFVSALVLSYSRSDVLPSPKFHGHIQLSLLNTRYKTGQCLNAMCILSYPTLA